MTIELFTTRTGKQVAVPEITIPKDALTSVMALQEDYLERGDHLSLTGIVLDLLDKGIRQTRNQWKNVEKSSNLRNYASEMVKIMGPDGRIRPGCEEQARLMAIKYNLVKGMRLTPPEPTESELSDDELEAATSPKS